MLALGPSLTYRNAASVLRDGLSRVAAGETAVDCATLAQVDSSAVAVLLAWQRAAAARGQSLSLGAVPPQLADLASLYGVDGLLGLAAAAVPSAPSASAAPGSHHRH